MLELPPIRVRVRAPRVFVFRALSGLESTAAEWPAGYRPELVEQREDHALVRFTVVRVGRRVSVTAAMTVEPPSRIRYRRLDDPLAEVVEELVLTSEDDSTIVEQRATVARPTPLVGALAERIAGAVLRREMVRMLERLRVTVEAEALASGVVSPRASDEGPTGAGAKAVSQAVHGGVDGGATQSDEAPADAASGTDGDDRGSTGRGPASRPDGSTAAEPRRDVP